MPRQRGSYGARLARRARRNRCPPTTAKQNDKNGGVTRFSGSATAQSSLVPKKLPESRSSGGKRVKSTSTAQTNVQHEHGGAPCTCSDAHGGAEPRPKSTKPSIVLNPEDDVESTAGLQSSDDDEATTSAKHISHVHISVAYESPNPEDTGSESTTPQPDGAVANMRRVPASNSSSSENAPTQNDSIATQAPSSPSVTASAESEKEDASIAEGEFVRSVAAAAPPLSPSTTRVITHAEVAKHNTCEDCWIISHGKVYDVTRYVPLVASHCNSSCCMSSQR